MSSAVLNQRAARIADQLLELISVSKLNPGDRLPPERQLSELLEVSRPSLREALHILQARGLVAIKHGQGTFVEEPLVAVKGPEVAPKVVEVWLIGVTS